jgi:hypothetical protein
MRFQAGEEAFVQAFTAAEAPLSINEKFPAAEAHDPASDTITPPATSEV